MREFNLHKALSGKVALQTMGGDTVMSLSYHKDATPPVIVASVKCKDGNVRAFPYSEDGKVRRPKKVIRDGVTMEDDSYDRTYTHHLDLTMKTEPKTRLGWINIYKFSGHHQQEHKRGGVFQSYDEARACAMPGLVDTVKVIWKE